MPLVRQSKIPALYDAGQLLAHLQISGYLDNLDVPDWADGTSVEELINALKTLGEGEWLITPSNESAPDLAGRWVCLYLDGARVPTPDETIAGIEPIFARAAAGDLEESIPSLLEYAHTLDENQKQAFIKRSTSDAKFARAMLEHTDGLAMTNAACVALSRAKYEAYEHRCLSPESLTDPDMLQMTLTVLTSKRVFDEMAELGEKAVKQGKSRAKALATQVRQRATDAAR